MAWQLWDWFFYGGLLRPNWSPAELLFTTAAALGLLLNLLAAYDAQEDLYFLKARRLNGARALVARGHRRAAGARALVKTVFFVIGLSSLRTPPSPLRTPTLKILVFGFLFAIGGLTWVDWRERQDRATLLHLMAHRHSVLDPDIDGVLTIDAASRITLASRGAARIFGATGDALIGRSLADLFPADEYALHRATMERYLATGESDTLGRPRHLIGRAADGELLPLEITFVEVGFAADRKWTLIVRQLSTIERD